MAIRRCTEQFKMTNNCAILLRIPSLYVRIPHNVLINPLHPQMNRVRVVDALPFMIDERMYGADDT